MLRQCLLEAQREAPYSSRSSPLYLEFFEVLVHIHNVLGASAWIIPVVHVVLRHRCRGHIASSHPLQRFSPQFSAGLSACPLT